ncbi:hypothetical protein GCM10027060_23630 [Nesterenkonia halophila]
MNLFRTFVEYYLDTWKHVFIYVEYGVVDNYYDTTPNLSRNSALKHGNFRTYHETLSLDSQLITKLYA